MPSSHRREEFASPGGGYKSIIEQHLGPSVFIKRNQRNVENCSQGHRDFLHGWARGPGCFTQAPLLGCLLSLFSINEALGVSQPWFESRLCLLGPWQHHGASPCLSFLLCEPHLYSRSSVLVTI
uniref:Uncharacterized protein n=1 Tax=Rousettus aegyptiacus TaxID=9407 RepID=A0A7J8H0V7_ROUAE|nr:hypothetical protein HJG63_011222 [Rousettus aegyptiacus]